jgi:uncharacterized protein (TIGR03067 family)
MNQTSYRFTLLIASVIALALTSQIKADEKAEINRLKGSWKVSSVVENGEAVPADKIAKFVLVFEGDKLEWKVNAEKEMTFTFKIRPDAKPKEIDLNEGQKATSAIYEMDGDTLKLCLPRRGSAERPKELAASKEKATTLITATRAKE